MTTDIQIHVARAGNFYPERNKRDRVHFRLHEIFGEILSAQCRKFLTRIPDDETRPVMHSYIHLGWSRIYTWPYRQVYGRMYVRMHGRTSGSIHGPGKGAGYGIGKQRGWMVAWRVAYLVTGGRECREGW